MKNNIAKIMGYVNVPRIRTYKYCSRMAICILLLPFIGLMSVCAQTRVETYLSDGWRFMKGDDARYAQPSYDDSKWEQVCVPHDWAISGPFDKSIDMQCVAIVQNGEKKASEKTGRSGSLPWIGSGWYRKEFKVSADFKRTIIQFDGAMSQPTIYINGKCVGHWAYGYNCFWFDITPYVNTGATNLLAVHLQNEPESSRWYPGAGIYRPVRLIQTQATAIDQWGTTVTTPVVSTEYARVSVENKLNNVTDKNVVVKVSILSPDNNTVVKAEDAYE